jgi:WD40 repeat protein
LALGNGGFDESTTIALTTLFYTSDLARTVPGIPAKFIDVELGIWGISWLSPTSLATIEEIDKDAEHFFLRVWNIKQPNQKPASFKLQGVLDVPIVDLTTQSMYNALTASPDGSTLAVSTDNGLLVGRLSATGGQMSWHQVGQVLTLGVNSISATAWSADGRYIAALTSINSLNNLLGIWDATRQYQALSPSQDLLRITGKMTHVVWSPVVHQALLAVGSNSGQVYIWNAQESSAPVRKLSGTLASPLTSLAWSHDGKWLAASYADPAASVLIWRV